MPLSINPQWPQIALYAAGAAVVLILLFNLPYVGRMLRSLFSFALLAFCLFLLMQQAPFEPTLARIAARLGIDGQQVSGNEVRIRMSPDGHFWARADINGISRRMLIDSGATVTTLSEATARRASVERGSGLLPIVMRTANGIVPAETGTVDRIALGGVEARRLKVAISPAIGDMDVLGMNFLSQLASWRVEGRTLIMTPRMEGSGQPRSRSSP